MDKTTMKRILLPVALLLVISAMADITIDSTRQTAYDYACVDATGAVLSSHQRQDKAITACAERKANDLDGIYDVQGGRWRINVTGVAEAAVVVVSPPPPAAASTDPCDGFSTLYYVRDGASGSGTSWSDAYDDLPATLDRDSCYYVADGSYSSYTFNDAESGTEVIAIGKATESYHGTETGWDSTYGDGQATFSRWDLDANYVVIDGATGGGSTNWDGPFGFVVTGTTGRRLEFYSSSNNITIRHTEVTNTNNTPDSGVSFNGLIYARSNITDITFSYNKLHHVYGPVFHTGFGGYSDWIIEHTKMGDNTGDSSHSEIWSMLGNDSTTIRYNYIFQWRSTGGIVAINGPSGTTAPNNICEDVHIYGNIFDQGGTTAPYVITAIQDGSNDQYARRWKIHNNTFIGVESSSSSVNAIQLSTTGEANNEAYNNIYYGHTDTLSFAGVTHDYNWFSGASTYSETNGTAGASADPFTDSASGDYSLSAGLAGTSLSSPFNEDMLGVTRGGDSTWDRGALEYEE